MKYQAFFGHYCHQKVLTFLLSFTHPFLYFILSHCYPMHLSPLDKFCPEKFSYLFASVPAIPLRQAMAWESIFFFNKLFYFKNFIYLFLAVLGLAFCAWVFFSFGEQGLLSSCSAWASHCSGFSCHGAQALEHRLSSSGKWAVSPRYMGSSWTRDQTYVPCTGRRILNHCTTREVH